MLSDSYSRSIGKQKGGLSFFMTESEQGGSSSTSGTAENPNMSDNSTNNLVTAQVLQELVDMDDRKEQRERLANQVVPKNRKRVLEPAAGIKSEPSDADFLYEFLISATQRMHSSKCEREHLDTNDCDVLFLLSVRESLKTLTVGKKAMAKIRIQQVFFELQFPDA